MIKSQMLKRLFLVSLLMNVAYLGRLQGQEVAVNTLDGELFVFDIDPNETLQSLEEKVTSLVGKESSSVFIEIASKGHVSKIKMNTARQGSYLGYPRNYALEVNAAENADIRFIVTSLANKSLISIAFIKGELEEAGDRIDHLHPLRFLLTIFSDEEMKVGIRNVRGKGWIWNHFLSGLKDSLSVESNIGNLSDAMICDFAKRIEINVGIILPAVHAKNWDDLVDLLITHVPRKGDHDRYNCGAFLGNFSGCLSIN